MRDTNTRTRKTAQQGTVAGAVTVLLAYWLSWPVEVAVASTVVLTTAATWIHNYAIWRGWLPKP